MKTVPLNVLIDAVEAMKMLREVSDPHLVGDQWIEALRSWSALKAHVNEIIGEINIEVTE